MVNFMNALMDILTIIPYELSVFILFVLIFGFFGTLFYLYRSAFKLMTKMAIVAVIALIFVFAGMYYAFGVEPNTMLVKRSYIEVGGDQPMKIVFLADFHAWSLSDEYLNKVVAITNAENADYVLLGGDYVGGSEHEVSKLSPLKNLTAKKGIYAVMGNHDYMKVYGHDCPNLISLEDRWSKLGKELDKTNYSNFKGEMLGEKIVDKLEVMGITVLRNEYVPLSNSTMLVGLDDLWGCKTNYSKAIAGTENYSTNILLTHNQDAIPSGKLTDWNLVLAGHTHCGQARLPLIGSLPKAIGFSGKYDIGHYKLDEDSHIYTTCGIGNGPRFMAPPEITVIEIS